VSAACQQDEGLSRRRPDPFRSLHAALVVRGCSGRREDGYNADVRQYLALNGLLFGYLAALVSLKALLAVWWVWFATSAGATLAGVAGIVTVVLVANARFPTWCRDGFTWSEQHLVQSSLILALALLAFLFVWGVIDGERFRENLSASAQGAGVIFAFALLVGYGGRRAQRRGLS
jgi:hypothetical protein